MDYKDLWTSHSHRINADDSEKYMDEEDFKIAILEWESAKTVSRVELPVKPDFCNTLKNHIKTMAQSRENARDEEGNIYLGCKIQLLTLNHLLIYIDELGKNSV